MPVTARISSRYLWWLGLIALFCVSFSLWFLYDGMVTYPRQRERGLAREKLKEEGGDWLREWRKLAKTKGWPVTDPGEPKSEGEIYSQLVLAALVGLPGLLCAVSFLRVRKRRIEMDETGLRASWGQRLEFDQITRLDKKKWKSKGIAKIHYEQDGRARRMVLDDWKFDDVATETILREVESRIDVGQIVGGPPQPPLEDAPEDESGDLDSGVDQQQAD